MKYSALVLVALFASANVMAAEESVKAVDYKYGMDLDVATVISIVDQPHQPCSLVKSQMTYKDSQGEVHAVNYVKLDSECAQN
ncbi:DUF2790 domain-containing protein [Pseudomonas sp. 5P_3.1_Bac2]|uniref:DUF2790 domain-containing protein n=1 Tax=Pseudomonas sp. 5P_3.1_Bac2 TaxID=2971617 RepID=UPI0021C8DFDD|nr:DUF2790 domain-containing protein [Pseudomonas sp. 5P_3.1_Bac2]MCU1717899.1 DUF2790 domain-containing protein [Pseudomonas sp. 5P_3.1_Bac2]